jgi:hypothetical protein
VVTIGLLAEVHTQRDIAQILDKLIKASKASDDIGWNLCEVVVNRAQRMGDVDAPVKASVSDLGLY